MVDKIFGADFTDESNPTDSMTISVNNGLALVDVALGNLHKALAEATEAVPGVVELATGAEVQAGTDTERAVTPAGLQALTATDARDGIVELATSAEVIAGTDTERAVTPAGLQALTATVDRDGIIELANETEVLTGTDETRAVVPLHLRTLHKRAAGEGRALNLTLDVSVSSNNLSVAIRTINAVSPSSVDPVFVIINGTLQTLSSALGLTLNAGTNYFNAGSSELAGHDVNYFVYLIWRSSDSTIQLGFSRIPYGRTFADFSSTSTNELYLASAGSLVSTDVVVPIGRFTAKNSGSASYNWSLTGTGDVRNYPMSNTGWMTYTPTRSNVTPGTGPSAADYYQISHRDIQVINSFVLGTGGSLTGALGISLPFAPASWLPAFTNSGWGLYRPSSGARYSGSLLLNGGTLIVNVSTASGTYVADTSVTSTVPVTWAASDRFVLRYRYPIG